MICPKCGYACGNAKFCPECGEKLLGKTVNDSNAQVWSVGMPCPHCGGTKLDGNCCAFCGAQLILDVQNDPDAVEDSFELPKIVVGIGNWVDLNQGSITYYWNGLFAKTCYEIPYQQIVRVVYVREGQKNYGLTIVDGTDNLRNTFIASTDKDEIIYQLFCFLRTVAPNSAEFVLNDKYLTWDVSDKYVKRFDTDGFFNTFNPYRKNARRKIRELTGLTYPEAESVAARVLYKRQEALYLVNPSMAIRDLNRAIREHERESDRKREERKEREKQRRARR